jgi:4-diphosphocytidyl-2-C-methyl-D-erythritol kinase
VFEPLHLDLSKYHILVVYPGIHSNTALAYKGVTPKPSEVNIKKVLETMPVKEWKQYLKNDFESSVFKAYPEIGELKQKLYAMGALYACMSGSGSAVFGIFENKPVFDLTSNYSFHHQRPSV